MTPPEDPYSRTDYRRLIAWESRIRREEPFLRSLLARAPEPAVLDIGCGTGEHTAFFARQGARAVGLDRSESMVEKARDHESRGEGRFVLGDATRAREALPEEAPFGLAICLGNMLPHVLDEAEVSALFTEAHAMLCPGGLLLVQILNYRRILERGVRHLPVNLRPGEGEEEIVFLRLMRAESDERILFFPTTLVLDPDSEEPVRLEGTRRVELRPWTADSLRPILEGVGFEIELHGDMKGGAYEPLESADLVLVAVKPPPIGDRPVLG